MAPSSKREVGDSSGEEGDCGPGSGRVSKRQWQRAVKKARIEGEKSVRKELGQLKASKASKSGEAEGKGKGVQSFTQAAGRRRGSYSRRKEAVLRFQP